MLNFLKQLEGRKYRDNSRRECLIKSVYIDEYNKLRFEVHTYIKEKNKTAIDELSINFLLLEDFKEFIE